MSGDGIHSSDGPRIMLLVVVILPVAYASKPLPQFLMMLPPVETIEVTDTSTGPGKFSKRQSLILKLVDPAATTGLNG